MLHPASRTAVLALSAALLTGACAVTEQARTLPAPAPAEEGDGDGPAGGEPIPVEGDGGIGGDPGDGTVQDLMILDGDRVEVTGVCLVDDTPSYRVDLAGGATVTVTDPVGEGARLTYVDQGTTFTTTSAEDVNAQLATGVLSAQGETVADGQHRFVDTTVDLRDLPAC